MVLIGVIFVLNGNQKQAKDEMQQFSVTTHDFQKVLAYENDIIGKCI